MADRCCHALDYLRFRLNSRHDSLAEILCGCGRYDPEKIRSRDSRRFKKIRSRDSRRFKKIQEDTIQRFGKEDTIPQCDSPAHPQLYPQFDGLAPNHTKKALVTNQTIHKKPTPPSTRRLTLTLTLTLNP
jgi:hypothetical protein